MIRAKLNSFTIVEMIVALILTTLVFSISLVAYRIIQSQLNRYVTSSTGQIEYLSFIKAINADVRNCSRLIATTDGFECESEEQTIRYIIQDSLVIRENNDALLDSFSFKQLEARRFFEGKEVLDAGTAVDDITMSFLVEDITYYVNAYKIYDAHTLIKLKESGDARY